jgi:glutamate-ammonia-ligase adenylyltransferase
MGFSSDSSRAEAIRDLVRTFSGKFASGAAEENLFSSAVECLYSALGGGETSLALVKKILSQLSESPSPRQALNAFERYVATYQNAVELADEFERYPEALSVLVAVCGFSHFLTDLLVREPTLLWWIVHDGRLHKEKSYPEYREESRALVEGARSSEEAHEQLCRWKYRELLRVAVRDILRIVSIEEITREISDIAQACIAAAADVVWEELVSAYGEPRAESEIAPNQPAGMCILGMGKLGGRELNFSSDIDLVFIYDAEGYTTGKLPTGKSVAPVTNHFFFNKMGEKLVRFLSTRTAHGHLFRVDMRLRPEGKVGPLARSLESFINYLDQQARDWERLAYLKARILAGPAPLAERIYRFTQRFVFDSADPKLVIAEIEKLKMMIDREVHLSDIYHREVKRGYGGIREIEFVISAMQIIYGQSHTALRVRNIFLAIDRLAEVNVLPKDEAEFYLRAYQFLRLVEHRLQMAEEHQTHTLPNEADKLEILAKRCYFSSAAEFMDEYRKVTDGVHERFVRFFERDVESETRELQDVLILLDRDAPAEQALAVLERYHIASPDLLRLIHNLAYGTSEVFISSEGQRFFEQMLPSLLRLIATAPKPHAVLRHFNSFILSIRGITYYYELIAQHPDILRLLVMLFGTSDYFSETLCAHPEFFDAILGSRLVYEELSPAAVRERLSQMVDVRRSIDKRLVLLHKAVKLEQLLVAVRFLLGIKPLGELLQELSIIADEALAKAYSLARERYSERQQLLKHQLPHIPDDFPITIIALGKFGGSEISFFSDLDLVYVWDDVTTKPSGSLCSSQEDALRFVEQFVYAVTENLEEGRLYSLDARLRPYGRNSPLVTPLSHYLSYLEERAEVWELLTLTRARLCVGDVSIPQRLQAAALKRLRSFSEQEVTEHVRSMRMRLEETVSPQDVRNGEFKRSPGGIVDIEFLIQMWILQGKIPWCNQSYFSLFAEQQKKVDECSEDEWQILASSYQFLRAVETATRLLAQEALTRLPHSDAQLTALARFLGEKDGEALKSKILSTRQEVRRIFLKAVGGNSSQ